MAFIVAKKIKGREYYYLRESKRVDGKVKAVTLAYLGKDKEEAERRAAEVLKGGDMNKSAGNKAVPKAQSSITRLSSGKGKDLKSEGEKDDSMEKGPTDLTIDELATFCKRKGIAFPSGEIYGGLAGFWDFGPAGAELKQNLKASWWQTFVRSREDMTGIDGAIVTHPKVWVASGHVSGFSDVFVECLKCKKANKVDKHELDDAVCSFCEGELDKKGAKDFNLLFPLPIGAENQVTAYLRGETAQLIFADFKQVQEQARMKLPFGIAQMGKAFRNEISPREFLFRTRELEQMEIEYFIRSGQECPWVSEVRDEEIAVLSEEAQTAEKDAEKMTLGLALDKKIVRRDWHAYWIGQSLKWFIGLGARREKFRIRQHKKDELSHYSSDTWDLEYEFPMGWRELQGFADRGTYDLSQHEEHSGANLKMQDVDGKPVLPEVVCEPSWGVGRALLVFLFEAYRDDTERGNVVLSLSPELAPVKAAVFPIVKKDEKVVGIAREVYDSLRKEWNVQYDEGGSVGRRYARQDEQGTPYCITVDGESVEKDSVTLRDRDTAAQVRVGVKDVKDVLGKLLKGELEFSKAGEKV